MDIHPLEFRKRVAAGLNAVQDACDAVDPERTQALPQDLRELLSMVRTAASELILSASLDEAINRLKRDRLSLAAVAQVSILGRSYEEIEAATRHALESSSENTPDLPCFVFGSYLIELCNGLEPGKRPPQSFP